MFNQQLLHGHSKVTGSFRQLNRKKRKKIEEKKLLSYIKFYSLQEKSLQGNLINSHCYAISLEKESLQQQLPTKLPPPSLKITQPPALKPHAPLPPQPCLFLSQFLNFILSSSFFPYLPAWRKLPDPREHVQLETVLTSTQQPWFYRKQIKAVK